MSSPIGSDVQRAIDFLTSPDLAKLQQLPPPPRADYDCLAQFASERGHMLTPGGIREAFRLLMCVRLLALQTPFRSGPDNR